MSSSRADGLVTKFVILTAPRSGSNMLCTLLNSHPEILCHHEIFTPDGIFYALHLRDGSFGLGTAAERDGDPLAFLEKVWRSPLDSPCVGFKLCLRQNEEVRQTVLRDQSVRKILIKRRNRIKTFVSRLIAEETKQWEVYRAEELIEKPPKVKVEMNALVEDIENTNQFYTETKHLLQSLDQAFVEVSYEELCVGQEQQRLLQFLGRSPHAPSLQVSSVKQNSPDLRDLIANFAEVEAAVRGIPLEEELYNLDC